MVPTASLSWVLACLRAALMSSARPARALADFLAAAASAALTRMKFFSADLVAAARFFLASEAMERIAKRSCLRISLRASAELRRRPSIWELARLVRVLISVVMRMLSAALVLAAILVSLFSALLIWASPFLIASRTAFFSSALLEAIRVL